MAWGVITQERARLLMPGPAPESPSPVVEGTFSETAPQPGDGREEREEGKESKASRNQVIWLLRERR